MVSALYIALRLRLPRTSMLNRMRDPMTSSAGPGDAHARLIELRAATIRRAKSLSSSFDDIVEAASDVATDDEHDPEGHTIAWERQQLAALLDETKMTLVDIEAAQQRLIDGLYGTCTICGRGIGTERLEALPATATCVTCAR
jgi:DnaK suppressor protein